MQFNDHSSIQGSHSFLSPSQYHWIRYTEDRLLEKLRNHQAALDGTKKHEYAETAITLGRKQGGTNDALKMYINDAIAYKMTPEVTLYYSRWCFGTADALSFRKNTLRIHDLKTGSSKASMDQLLVYAAIFCLEYDVSPSEIVMELRIYQSGDIIVHVPDWEEVRSIMDTIIQADKIIELHMD